MSPIPLKAALRLAKSRFKDNPHVISVGVGFKYSRKCGYNHGRRALGADSCVPCIKLLVRKKLTKSRASQLMRQQRIPGAIIVRTRSRSVRVRTDVEDARHLAQHSEQVASEATPQSFGTAGVVVQAVGLNRKWLLTAGHVFRGPRSVASAAESRALVGGTLVGVVAWDTWKPTSGGGHLDAVAIDLGGEVPPSIRGKPLTGMAKERWTFLKTLEAWQRHRLVYFNAEGAASGRSVAVLDVVYQGEVTLPLADGTDLVYSPLVVGLRVVEGSIGYGDSGAAWSDVADRLLGMHTVGNAQTGAYSYCQLIDGVMEALQAVLGVRLEGS